MVCLEIMIGKIDTNHNEFNAVKPCTNCGAFFILVCFLPQSKH